MADHDPSDASRPLNTPRTPGAPAGDFGAADDELLVDGQEEVFSRAEVESGRIEHLTSAGGGENGAEADAPRVPTDRTTAPPRAGR